MVFTIVGLVIAAGLVVLVLVRSHESSSPLKTVESFKMGLEKISPEGETAPRPPGAGAERPRGVRAERSRDAGTERPGPTAPRSNEASTDLDESPNETSRSSAESA